MSNQYELQINNDVLANMAQMAALETQGVAGMGVKPASLHSIIRKKGESKSVTVTNENGIINIELYIKVSNTEKASVIAERVQSGVKDKLQAMTGNAVTKVNVVVSDIEFSDDAVQPEEPEKAE